MKFLLSFLLLFACLVAQPQGVVSKISQQLNGYFGAQPGEKVFIATSKTIYKPGEKLWFRVFVTDAANLPDPRPEADLMVKLFDATGKPLVQELFKLHKGAASCDLPIPADLPAGACFLCACTTSCSGAGEVSYLAIRVDPSANNQWLAAHSLKDSISLAGKANEARVSLKEISGEVQKSTNLRYQLMNGSESLAGGKVKTDGSGGVSIPFTLPSRTNGAPFTLEITDNRGTWKKSIFLPSSMDSVFVRFYPEGGRLVAGTVCRIGFTASNKWGLPVDLEGSIVDPEGKIITPVQTFARGLGMFSLEAIQGSQFKMVLSGESHLHQGFDLPMPLTNGMALSVLKSDADFITASLFFNDKQKHPVSLVLTRGSNISWAADMEVTGSSRIKIPATELAQGISLLSAFSPEGFLLGERIVFVDKKQELKIEVLPQKSSIMQGEPVKVQVRLTDEAGRPVAGNVSVAVSDLAWNAKQPSITERLNLGEELETPVSLISAALKGKVSSNNLLDVFLIANRLKGFDWGKILSYFPGDGRVRAGGLNLYLDKNFDTQLSTYVAAYATKLSLEERVTGPDPLYFSDNEGLFERPVKVYKPSTMALENQRRMFASSTSILDVIKTIKPYKIQNNMIVFYGSENSLNYQGGALIVLDGQMMGTDINALSGISPLEVDHINVSTNPMDIQKYTGLNSVGLIEIFQKTAKMKEEEPSKSNGSKYDGKYRVPGQFPAEPSNPKKELRTTLLWIPELKVSAEGLFEFTLTGGAVRSGFMINVQGLSDDGRTGSGEAVVKVGR